MSKCRICFKYSKKLRSLFDSEDGITFHDMISFFSNTKLCRDPNIPVNICLSCLKKLREAYTFKLDIERSEMVLNETAYFKRLNFYNIRDLNIKIDTHLISPMNNCLEDLFKHDDDAKTITYNDTIITRLTRLKEDTYYDGQENQMSVKEFLNSVKLESDDSYCEQDYEIDSDYDSNNYNNHSYDKIITVSKKTNRNCNKKLKFKRSTQSQHKRELKYLVRNPIKPIYLKDVKIKHTIHVKNQVKPKKKYRYPVKTSICPYCGKSLISKYISMHIKRHTSVRAYKCNVCSKSFFTQECLELHKQKHTAPKTFKCNQCIASFISNTLLISHMSVHSEEKRYSCPICNKAFKWRSALPRHLLIHSFGKKAFQCDLCPMTFHTKTNLGHHMRIHTGERPYKCEICAQPYSYKHDFNRHCLKKHGVFLKGRLVNVMNEEVLEQERVLMKELALIAHTDVKEKDIPKVFLNSGGIIAFKHALKAVQARQIPIIET